MIFLSLNDKTCSYKSYFSSASTSPESLTLNVELIKSFWIEFLFGIISQLDLTMFLVVVVCEETKSSCIEFAIQTLYFQCSAAFGPF